MKSLFLLPLKALVLFLLMKKILEYRKSGLTGIVLFFSIINIRAVAPPVITSFSPTSGPVGTTVTITGSNFNTAPENNIVFFGATRATVSSASATSLVVTVPAGATYQSISVTEITTGLTGYSAKPFINTFAGGNIVAAGSFIEDGFPFLPEGKPVNFSIGDLDGDGRPDLAVSVEGKDTVSILINTSANRVTSFAYKANFPIGGSTGLGNGVSIGDLDGDGKLDLVVANYFDTTLSILRNTCSIGSLSFETKVDYRTGNGPSTISIGDLDGDGKPDLVFANNLDATFSVLRNKSIKGTISFAPKVDFATGLYPMNVAISDLDGDGKPDVVVVNNGSSTVSVFRNTSTIDSISFADKVDLIVGTYSGSISIGDLDGDGKPDLAVLSGGGSGKVSILKNTCLNGTISFADKIDFATGPQAASLAIGDLDGDGKPDLAVTEWIDSSGEVSVFHNTSISGNISFSTRVDFNTGYYFSSPSAVSIGDLNGDGMPDLAFVNNKYWSITVFRNTNRAPVVSYFSPITGLFGTTITITGANFTGATNVSFGNTPAASFTVVSDTHITATLAEGTSGTVDITSPYGTGSRPGFYYILSQIISGNVGTANAILSYTEGVFKTDTADGSGNYSLRVTKFWSGKVVPGLIGQVFNPAFKSYYNVITDQTSQNYVASPVNIWINGAWSLGLPNPSSDAAIAPNNTSLSNFDCKNLSIGQNPLSPTDSVSITADLTVNDTLTNTGKTVLILPAGSLIVNDTIIDQGQMSAQVAVSAGSLSASDYTWHMMSPPTANFPVEQSFTGDYVYEYIESSNSWNVLKTGDLFKTGHGYIVKTLNTGGKTEVFTGTYNFGNQSFGLTNTGSDAAHGYNLVGNPYSSAIDWNAASGWTKNNIDNTIWIWNPVTNIYDTYDGFTGTGSRFIPATQGFFVHVSAGSASGTLSMTKGVQVHNNVISLLKSANQKTDVLRLDVTGRRYRDELVVYQNDGANTAYKIFSMNPSVPEIYASAVNVKYAIYKIPTEAGSIDLNIGFHCDSSGTYALSVPEFSSSNLKAELEDLKSGVKTSLTSSTYYEFNYEVNDNETRFILHLSASGPSGIGDEQTANRPLVWSNGNEILVKVPEEVNTDVAVYNLLGVKLSENRFEGSGTKTLNQNVTPGIYLVRINYKGRTSIKKLWVE